LAELVGDDRLHRVPGAGQDLIGSACDPFGGVRIPGQRLDEPPLLRGEPDQVRETEVESHRLRLVPRVPRPDEVAGHREESRPRVLDVGADATIVGCERGHFF
jgi:hypothetical protein